MRKLALAVVLAGCGGNSDPTPGIDGNWVFEHDDNVCATGLKAHDGAYEIVTLCELEGGGYGAESEKGLFTVDGDQVSFTPTGSTCKDGDRGTDVATFDASDDSLRLMFDSGVLLFEPIKGSESSTGAITYGCYDDSGAFTPMPAIEY